MKSDTVVDFSGGLPGEIIFSADLSSGFDGLVLYVNGIAALGFRAPAPFENTDPSIGLSATGLPSQFRLSTNFFSEGLNTIEVALYSDGRPILFVLRQLPLGDRHERRPGRSSLFPSRPGSCPSAHS